MNDIFLMDITRALAIFLITFVLFILYCYYSTRTPPQSRLGANFSPRLSTIKGLLYSKYALGPVAVATMISLFFAESLAAVLTIGGFFMGLLYLLLSQRP